MPQILLLAAVGAGLLLLKRYLKREQERVVSDLRKAKESMEQSMERRDIDHAVPLERDPATGIYRPKQSR